MDVREEILNHYTAFNDYLESVDLSKLKEQLTREEMNEFTSVLFNTKGRNLAIEVSDMAKEMKIEEYPQLLGVHRFPILNDIDFLNEQQKIALDKYLGQHLVGNSVSGLWKITRNEKARKHLTQWLTTHNVLEENYFVLCPSCLDGFVTSNMDSEEKNHLLSLLEEFKNDNRYELWEELSNKLGGCMECEDMLVIEELKELNFKTYHKMAMERDKSLDNI